MRVRVVFVLFTAVSHVPTQCLAHGRSSKYSLKGNSFSGFIAEKLRSHPLPAGTLNPYLPGP